MKFEEDTRLSCMTAETVFKGHEIKVRLTIENLNDLEQVGTQAIRHVDENWDKIQSSIIHHLYDLYINEWAEEDEPICSKEVFLEKIYPKTIGFDDYEDKDSRPTYTMYFDDSSLFGFHGIQIYWDRDDLESIDVSLVG